MPYSADEGKQFTKEIIKGRMHKVDEWATVLDVGAGAGTYGKLIREIDRELNRDTRLEAIEVWEPYIETFNLRHIYDQVMIKDVREHDSFNYDFVIFGDVLEHMSEKEAKDLVWKAQGNAGHVIISLPIVHYPQGPFDGNPYEEHIQEHIHPEDIPRLFGTPTIKAEYSVVGVYIYF